MKRFLLLLPLLLNDGLCLASVEAFIRTRPISEILGSTHVSGRYYFGEEDFLNEGANRLLELGTGVFKGWLTPGFRTAYPYNSDWPEEVESLLQLIQAPHYQDLLEKPFSTYSFVVGEFCRPNWKDGLSEREALEVEGENYDLAAYLLTRYKNSGKTFILQNWEGDNALRAWDIEDPVAYERARQGMVDWLNARQAGINRARLTFGMEGVRVVGAVEMTRTPVGRRPFDHPLVVDAVVPHTKADLYAFSTWGTRLPGDEHLLLAQLEYIRQKAPASDLFGEKNVMLGEFGAYELTYTHPHQNYPDNADTAEPGLFNAASARGQLIANRKQLEYALEWGVQYALYWELYCNGFRDGFDQRSLSKDANGNRVATASDLKGVWLIRPDGTKAPTWYYFRNLFRGDYIADNLRDWSRTVARSAYLQKPAQTQFVGNQSSQPGALLYRVEDLSFAAARILHNADQSPSARLYVSADSQTWEEVAVTHQSGPALAGSGWRFGWIIADSIPEGQAFLKVELPPQSAQNVRLHKVVAESASVASDPFRHHYRFIEGDGLLLDGQPLEGFDPEVTRYEVRQTSETPPTVELLLADPRLAVTSDVGWDANDNLQVRIGFPGEEKRVYEIHLKRR